MQTWNNDTTKNNNLDHMINVTFRNINRLFVLWFKNGDKGPATFFGEYYMLFVKIKYFNTLIENRPFFDQPVKNKQEAYGKLVKMPKNNDIQ